MTFNITMTQLFSLREILRQGSTQPRSKVESSDKRKPRFGLGRLPKPKGLGFRV